MNIQINNQAINDICSKDKIKYLGLFGSTARGEEKPDSDVDLVVDFENTKSFFELSRIQEKLEQIFQRPVDLVLKNKIKESLKNYIKKDLVTLYEKR